MQQTEAKIFLSDQRGCTQTDTFRSFHTFNFGSFFNENKKPFGTLQAFNEDTLTADATIAQTIEAQTTVVLIPIFGAIEVKNGFNTEGVYITSGEAYFFKTVNEEAITISNPYDSDMVNYIQMRLQNDEYQPFNNEQITTFDFIENKNQLIPYFSDNKNYGFIGQYEGRKESVYTIKNPQNGVFVFVIEGVFEVQNRLLHARDGLALWDVEEVELEALSNNAVILLVEMPFFVPK